MVVQVLQESKDRPLRCRLDQNPTPEKAKSSNTARTRGRSEAGEKAGAITEPATLAAMAGVGGVLLLGLVVLLFFLRSGQRPPLADQGKAGQQDKGKEIAKGADAGVKGEPKKVEPPPVGWNTSKAGAVSTNSLGMKFAYVLGGVSGWAVAAASRATRKWRSLTISSSACTR